MRKLFKVATLTTLFAGLCIGTPLKYMVVIQNIFNLVEPINIYVNQLI